MGIFSEDNYKEKLIQVGNDTYKIIDDGNDPLKEPNVRVGSTFDVEDHSQFDTSVINPFSNDKVNLKGGKIRNCCVNNVDLSPITRLNRVIDVIYDIKKTHKPDMRVAELCKTAILAVEDLRDTLKNQFAKVTYNPMERYIKISLNETANEKLKDLITNKDFSDLDHNDIFNIEEAIENEVIKFIEDKE